MSVIVRPIAFEDRPSWDILWAGYQAFYETAIPPATSERTFMRFFDAASPVNALVAERDGRIVGIVHYIFHESCWTTDPYCYLQDLFADETLRGEGIGRALIEAVYKAAEEKGAARVYWLTQHTNAVAMRLYDRVAEKSGFLQYRKML